MDLKYYFVSYAFATMDGRAENGSVTISDDEPYFNVLHIQNNIMAASALKFKSLVVLYWKEISKEEFEYNKAPQSEIVAVKKYTRADPEYGLCEWCEHDGKAARCIKCEWLLDGEDDLWEMKQ